MLQDAKPTDKNEKATEDKNGWGYVVCAGTILAFIAGIGHVNSFGLIYKDFVLDSGSSSKSITTAHGLFAIMLALGGCILNAMSKKFTMRLCGLFGSFLYIVGAFLTLFITDTSQLPITFGVFQGIGFGVMVPVSYSVINGYFIEKRTTVMSVCKSVQGVIQICYPQFLKVVIFEYGFRGVLLILSGISLNTSVAMLTMIPKAETKKLSSRSPEQEDPESHSLMAAQVVENEKNLNFRRSSWWRTCKFLNLQLMKDIAYCNVITGLAFVSFSDLSFFLLEPMLLFQFGFSQDDVAMCISITASGDVAGRIILVALSSMAKVDTRTIYYVATLLTMVFRVALIQAVTLRGVLVCTACLGVLRAWLHIASPLVVASRVPHRDFPAAYALYLLLAGFINLFFNPLVGWLTDIYGDYRPAFYGLAACCLPCVVFWPLEYLQQALNRKGKRPEKSTEHFG